MSTLPDFVPLLIKLIIGSHFLHFLNSTEAGFVDDRGMMVLRSYYFIRFIPDLLCCRILSTDRLPIDRVSRILLIGKDVSDSPDRPSPFPSGTAHVSVGFGVYVLSNTY